MSSVNKKTLPRVAQPVLPPWVPQRPPVEWTLSEVVNHVKTAMMIELTTIPLYLYAAYSIDTTSTNLSPNTLAAGQDAQSKIINIAIQEMFHLALSGNLLCALDGTIEIYDSRIIPQFPGAILYERVEMNLDRADQSNITDFKEIEQPVDQAQIRLAFAKAAASSPIVIPDYRSIGEFYENLKQGLATLSDSHLMNNPDYQFSSSDFRGANIINTQKVAQDSLELIVEQGEGGPDVKDSHYSIFTQLSAQPPAWKVFNVRKNPKTSDFKGLGTPPNFAYKLSLALDAAYCYLLQNIQRVWGRGGNQPTLHQLLVDNMLTIMRSVLPPLVDILTHQTLTSAGDVAAPCFDYYPFQDNGEPATPLQPEDLHSDLVKLVLDAAGLAAQDPSTTQYVQTLKDMAQTISTDLPPRPAST